MLSNGEKLLVFMMCDLMKALKVNDEIDPAFVLEAVRSGHSWGIWEEYPSLFAKDDDETLVREVRRSLDMCSFVEYSIACLPADEREQIPRDERKVFLNWCVPEEIEHLTISRFLTNRPGRYDQLKRRDFNAPHRMAGVYNRMADAWEKVGNGGPNPLSLRDIKTVLAARGSGAPSGA